MKLVRLALLTSLTACASAGTAPLRSAEPPSEAAKPATVVPQAPGDSLLGQVRHQDGTPASGAKVDLLPHEPQWDLRVDPPAVSVQAGSDGRFRVPPLPPGTYGVSATLSDGSVILGQSIAVKSDTPLAPLELRMAQTPVHLRGQVEDESGHLLRGASVRIVHPIVPFDDIAFLPPLPEGRFEARLPAGDYTLVVLAPGFSPKMHRVPSQQDGPVTVRMERRPTEAERQAAVEWVKATAVRLKTVEPGHGFEDLRALKPVLEHRRVVALGEATHGSREFFQLKHRLVEYLVTELGFTVFALEANYTEARAINAYILGGPGDPARLLAALMVFPWNTQEMGELLLWMRRYNASAPHARKLKFYGLDMQLPRTAAANTQRYLAKVDAAFLEEVKEPLGQLSAQDWYQFPTWPAERQQAVLEAVLETERRFDSRRARYSRQTGASAWVVARQDLTVLRQCVLSLKNPQDYEARDRAMAENLRWALAQEAPGTKAVVWAHNTHVARAAGEYLEFPLGRHLAEAFGEGLYSFGFAFNQGAFQAINLDEAAPAERKGLVAFSVPPAPEQSLDGTLASTGLPFFALDLRALPAKGPAREWWSRAMRTRDPGALYSDAGYPMSQIHPLSLHDGLLFVERTTRAHPNVHPQAPPADEQAP